ncbi:hypothetical protein [Fischerella muscicola]|nr:hypothetical protein [Fischerella muscicola]
MNFTEINPLTLLSLPLAERCSFMSRYAIAVAQLPSNLFCTN